MASIANTEPTRKRELEDDDDDPVYKLYSWENRDDYVPYTPADFARKRMRTERQTGLHAPRIPADFAVTKGILSMPDEILEKILNKLRFIDVANLGKTCRKFHKMFHRFCKDPVVFYRDRGCCDKSRGLAHLRKAVKLVSFSWVHTMTIIEPRECRLILNAAIVQDIKKRCPSLRRLILKNHPDDVYCKVEDYAIQQLPASLVLEAHNVFVIGDNYQSIRFIHGIFHGPFDDWTTDYIEENRDEPGFCEFLPGGFTLWREFDTQSDRDDYLSRWKADAMGMNSRSGCSIQ